MGNGLSQPTGHYQAGPQYQAPPTHFNHGYTMRETEHFKGGYTLRDPPKKKKMGLVGVPEYPSPNHSRYSQGSDLGIAAARAAFSQAPQTFPQSSSAAAQTAWTLPPPKQHFKHGHSLRNTPNVSPFAEPSHFGSRDPPQQTFSQPAHQPFSHGYSLRNPAKKAKHYNTFHDMPAYQEGNCRKGPPVQHPWPENHRRSKKSFW
ncbi:hypothetical protein FAGAP_360 [Fusarium agapanthi]|uniref:Uncharacterized protein n=1 Tax=Fusarium agapanthi TaxID=1803897 RepID=A0A9P5EI58_9HYPO|nr:hypothetical protein FAGAP_360 [Fusarium agapanthi]